MNSCNRLPGPYSNRQKAIIVSSQAKPNCEPSGKRVLMCRADRTIKLEDRTCLRQLRLFVQGIAAIKTEEKHRAW